MLTFYIRPFLHTLFFLTHFHYIPPCLSVSLSLSLPMSVCLSLCLFTSSSVSSIFPISHHFYIFLRIPIYIYFHHFNSIFLQPVSCFVPVPLFVLVTFPFNYFQNPSHSPPPYPPLFSISSLPPLSSPPPLPRLPLPFSLSLFIHFYKSALNSLSDSMREIWSAKVFLIFQTNNPQKYNTKQNLFYCNFISIYRFVYCLFSHHFFFFYGGSLMDVAFQTA